VDWQPFDTLKAEAIRLGIGQWVIDKAEREGGPVEAYKTLLPFVESARPRPIAVAPPIAAATVAPARVGVPLAQSVPSSARTVVATVPRVKGFRSMRDGRLALLKPVYKFTWSALIDMADPETRIATTTLGGIAGWIKRHWGVAVATETIRNVIDYLAKVAQVIVVHTQPRVSREGATGQVRTEPGAYRAPLLKNLDARAVAARIKANPPGNANPREAARKRKARATDPRTSATG
jgi:hypothetical protein